MKHRYPLHLSLLVIVFVLSPGISAQTRAPFWEDNVESALDRAQESEKPIFLYITGGIWCDPCMMFEERTLSDSRLLSRIEADWIPLRLYDTDPTITRWRETIVPAVLLLDTTGTEIARISGNTTSEVVIAQIESIGRPDAEGLDTPGPALNRRGAREDDLSGAVFRLQTGTIWNGGGAVWYTEDLGLPLSFEEYDRDSAFLYLRNGETGTVVAITMVQESTDEGRRLWRWNRERNEWEEIGPLLRID